VTQTNRLSAWKQFELLTVWILILCFVFDVQSWAYTASPIGFQTTPQTAPPPAAPAAPVDTSPAALDHLLAPIALYPDALLMQVLAASLDTQEVLDGGNWLLENKSLEGSALDDAAKKAGFGAAMTALFRFPDVVDLMCTELDWTQQVGEAFKADQAGVLASVQRLRAQAVQYGNLKSTSQQKVETQTDNGKQVIVIQPANPQVVYVPQYNPETVYVAPPSTGAVVATSIISFGLGVAVGALFTSNNYYYPRWGYGGVYYGGRPWYPARYAYHPIYTPHYRPAYGYRPPPNYPYHSGYRNPNYYNRYRPPNNGGGYRPPNNGGGYRPPNGGGNTRPPYNGGGNNRPPNNGGGNRPPNGGGYNKPPTTLPAKPGGGYNKPTTPPATRPGNGNNGGTRPTTRPAVQPDRGYTKPATRPATPQNRPTPQTRPVPQTRPTNTNARPAGNQNRPSAFQGGGSGQSTRQASQRGAASSAGRKPR
jgi:Protein of unknown function (DUF3300)